MHSNKKVNIILLLIIALSFAVGLIIYPHLPDQVASHWNAQGQADGYMGKFWGIFLLPVIMVGLFLLYAAIPWIDPLKTNIESFRKHYNLFWIFIFGFFFYIFALTLGWNLGWRFDFTAFIMPAVAGLFYFIGAVLEKSKRNWFMGIRTPWTLSSDVVWEKTHKFGGKLFKISGIISLGGLIFGGTIAIIAIIGSALLITLITTVYSYFEYKKLGQNKK